MALPHTPDDLLPKFCLDRQQIIVYPDNSIRQVEVDMFPPKYERSFAGWLTWGNNGSFLDAPIGACGIAIVPLKLKMKRETCSEQQQPQLVQQRR